jgi:molybdate transport repressor ModE-like protein
MEMPLKGLKANFKIWLETENGYVFGEGLFELLSKVMELGTLSAAARSLGMSYRHAWGIVKNVEKRLRTRILVTRKGGIMGGGATLTENGTTLLNDYVKLRKIFSCVSGTVSEGDFDHAVGLEGYVTGTVSNSVGEETQTVDIEIAGGNDAKILIVSHELGNKKQLAVGDKLRFVLKDAILKIENTH